MTVNSIDRGLLRSMANEVSFTKLNQYTLGDTFDISQALWTIQLDLSEARSVKYFFNLLNNALTKRLGAERAAEVRMAFKAKYNATEIFKLDEKVNHTWVLHGFTGDKLTWGWEPHR